MMRIGSLFSGIGGLELGLEWSGIGETVWQVEIDPFCRTILDRHWPGVIRHADIRTVGSRNLQPVDLICGGFPCQDVSSAGKGEGLAGERSGLWFEFARIVGELRPQWVVVENVASGAKRWVDAIITGLEQLGYEALPIPLSAAAVGAPHLRNRIFVVAYSNSERWREGRPWGVGSRGEGWRPDAQTRAVDGHADGDGQHAVAVDGEVEGQRSDTGASTDADSDELRQQQGRSGGARGARATEPGGAGESREAADTAGAGQSRSVVASGEAQRPVPAERPWAADTMPQPAIHRVDDGVSAVVGRRRSAARLRGASRRTHELRALGNGVVPQCAEVVGWVIRELAS